MWYCRHDQQCSSNIICSHFGDDVNHLVKILHAMSIALPNIHLVINVVDIWRTKELKVKTCLTFPEAQKISWCLRSEQSFISVVH